MKLKIVISGWPLLLTARKSMRIAELIVTARAKGGHMGNDLDWEARDAGGRLLDPGITVKDASLVDGQSVYVNPRAGIGGNVIFAATNEPAYQTEAP